MIILGDQHSRTEHKEDNYEIVIRIMHVFLNRNIDIIMDSWYNENPMGSLGV